MSSCTVVPLINSSSLGFSKMCCPLELLGPSCLGFSFLESHRTRVRQQPCSLGPVGCLHFPSIARAGGGNQIEIAKSWMEPCKEGGTAVSPARLGVGGGSSCQSGSRRGGCEPVSAERARDALLEDAVPGLGSRVSSPETSLPFRPCLPRIPLGWLIVSSLASQAPLPPSSRGSLLWKLAQHSRGARGGVLRRREGRYCLVAQIGLLVVRSEPWVARDTASMSCHHPLPKKTKTKLGSPLYFTHRIQLTRY